MNDIADITPDHSPVACAKEMLRKAPGCKAGIFCLMLEDGSLDYDSSAFQTKDLLWALEAMKFDLMRDRDD